MNSPAPTQLIGNICVGLAALIYALPLQFLLWEISRKRDDGGGFIAGLIILIPMWLLLLAGLCCVNTSGGFDGLRLSRGWFYPLLVMATLSMLALSFMAFEFPRHHDFFTRLIGRAPVYVFPIVTMSLVVLNLNPRLVSSIPFSSVKLIWLICAGLSLMLCGGFLGYRFAVAGTGRVQGLAQRLVPRGPSDREIIAQIATLDPQRDFTELLHRANQYQSRAVREAAIARLRTNPGFAENLSTALATRDPSAALEFLASATLAPSEQAKFALPARAAMERFIEDIPAPNYMSSDRRKQLQRWGRETFQTLAKKFTASGVDFKPTLEAFEHALRPDDTRRK